MDDKEIMEGLMSNAQEAFKELERYRRLIEGWAVYYGAKQPKEDVAQEIIYKAGRFRGYKPEEFCNMKAFLRRMTQNFIYADLRRRQIIEVSNSSLTDEELYNISSCLTSCSLVEQEYIDNEQRDLTVEFAEVFIKIIFDPVINMRIQYRQILIFRILQDRKDTDARNDERFGENASAWYMRAKGILCRHLKCQGYEVLGKFHFMKPNKKYTLVIRFSDGDCLYKIEPKGNARR